MHPVPRLSLAEQTALHLQHGIESGRWQGALPGAVRLASELGVSKDTLVDALSLLEERGSILSRGPGKRREVATTPSAASLRRPLRIGLLLRDELRQSVPLTQEIFLKLIHHLEAMGHKPLLAPKSQAELGLDPARIGRMIAKCQADAWIVSGAPAALANWLHRHGTPAILIGGQHGDHPFATASMDSSRAIHETVRRLIKLGHQRIVLVCLPDWVRPKPGKMVQAFYKQLADAGLPASEYNTPFHEATPQGFAKLLDSAFRLTPPTAMIVPHAHFAFAVMAFLGTRGLSVPRDLSLIVRGSDPAFEWIRPRIAHFDCPTADLIRHVLRWVDRCAKGKPDHQSKNIEATLIPGDTIAPPPARTSS
jgi:DNA-binding LacI/PurR family transcriptional regulator